MQLHKKTLSLRTMPNEAQDGYPGLLGYYNGIKLTQVVPLQ
jgi:hypothetical protein